MPRPPPESLLKLLREEGLPSVDPKELEQLKADEFRLVERLNIALSRHANREVDRLTVAALPSGDAFPNLVGAEPIGPPGEPMANSASTRHYGPTATPAARAPFHSHPDAYAASSQPEPLAPALNSALDRPLKDNTTTANDIERKVKGNRNLLLVALSAGCVLLALAGFGRRYGSDTNAAHLTQLSLAMGTTAKSVQRNASAMELLEPPRKSPKPTTPALINLDSKEPADGTEEDGSKDGTLAAQPRALPPAPTHGRSPAMRKSPWRPHKPAPEHSISGF